MKVKVKKNIGKKSEEKFGKVGMVYDLEDNVLGYFEDENQEEPFDPTKIPLFNFMRLPSSSPFELINTAKELNDHIKKKMELDYLTVFEEAEERTPLRIRVKENIGEKSERFFGGVGVILELDSDFIHTAEELNEYIKNHIHPFYYTIFEESKPTLLLLSIGSAKLIKIRGGVIYVA